ncbi:MAG TPA: sulfite exporter TauE/SafE family protein [Holophagaceae bacterium]|nr:sulfite exporter TauE/SafE family protein [Holophagaceae bacterium]
MHFSALHLGLLALITLAAAIVNGLLGHGFSSLTVPLGLLLTTNRVLNPILVLLEVPLNLGACLSSLRHFPKVARRILPFALALLPGILLGALALRLIAAGPLKLASYALLLPLVLISAVGGTKPRGGGGRGAALFGFGTGLLYGLTTISGPTLSIYFHGQGFAKAEYRAAISALRLLESTLTALVYLALGMLPSASVSSAAPLLPGVLVGLTIGAFLHGHVSEEGFRRAAVIFNVFTVSFGLSRALAGSALLPEWAGQLTWVALATLSLWALVEQAPRLRRLVSGSALPATPDPDGEAA